MRALLVALLLIAVPSTAQADLLTLEERAWVDEHGPIRYAPDPDYPPFEFVTEDGVEGINVDFLNRISRNLDIEFETVVHDNWSAVLAAMRAGEVDLLGSLAANPEREEYMDFYGPYMEVGEVYYVRDDSPYQSNEDMAGKRVAVIRDYAAAAWLAENRPDVELVPVDGMVAGLEAVSTGAVDGFFENIPVTAYVIRQGSYTNIRILDDPLYYSAANWGVQEGNALLLSIMEKGMRSIPLGEQTAVFEYWSGYDLGVRREVAPEPIWEMPVFWGLVAAVALAAAWVAALRRTVRFRTRELETLNHTLEDRVEERTADLQEANERLGSFAATVSHDLKQPLTVIAAQSQLAQMQRSNPASLEMVDNQVTRMQRYIEALLDFSRVAKPGEVQEIRLADVVADMKQLYPDCAIEVPAELVAHGDPDLMRILMQNLIGNAVKFGATRVEVDGDGRNFVVRDDGPGFDAAAVGTKIFEPFVRGDAGSVPGTGVGLATVARIVRVHGGEIWAESAPGEGASFHWTMERPRVAPGF